MRTSAAAGRTAPRRTNHVREVRPTASSPPGSASEPVTAAGAARSEPPPPRQPARATAVRASRRARTAPTVGRAAGSRASQPQRAAEDLLHDLVGAAADRAEARVARRPLEVRVGAEEAEQLVLE